MDGKVGSAEENFDRRTSDVVSFEGLKCGITPGIIYSGKKQS